MYREYDDSINLMIDWNITEKFRIGHIYDLFTSTIRKISSGSREIILSFMLK